MSARTNGPTATATVTLGKRFELPALDFKFSPLTEGTDIPPPLPSPVEEAPPAPRTTAGETLSNGAANSSKTSGAQPSTSTGADATANADASSSPSRSSLRRTGLKRSADDIPASPTLSSRPGSIRRLFSRNLLNTAYANAEAEGLSSSAASAGAGAGAASPRSTLRPDSRSDGSILDERRARRSSGWFRRLRGSADSAASGSTLNGNGSANGSSPLSKRASVLFEDLISAPKQQQQQSKQPPQQPTAPPPPMIPELAELQAKVDPNDEGSLGSDLFKNIN